MWIVALLGTNPAYFQRAGAGFESIGGVLAVAGAYDLRNLSGEPDSWQRVDGHIYGETPEARSLVSPSLHIDPHSRPAEIACGTQDDPGACPRAIFFERALRSAGIESRVLREAGADHIGLLRALIDPRDPLNQELHDFISRNGALP
jgi:hypothetical protein